MGRGRKITEAQDERPLKVLDLFAGLGGAEIGIREVFPNAEIEAVDTDPRTYPTLEHDALTLDEEFYRSFDFIWASPPWEYYASHQTAPNVLDKTLRLLEKIGVPYVVENVTNAVSYRPHAVILWGYYFETTRDMRRGRKFWSNFPIWKPYQLEKITPYFRLIGGKGGWIREGERDKVKRMTAEMVKQRWGLEGPMHYLAQIVLPEYAAYIMQYYRRWVDDQ